jgi:hypothetical protein
MTLAETGSSVSIMAVARAALVVEGDDALRRTAQVRHDESDARTKLDSSNYRVLLRDEFGVKSESAC